MDKQKQIEDLTALIDSFNIRTIKQAQYVAEYIVDKLNYRKILEGEVVLTREEYEKLKKFEYRVQSGVCMTQKEWFDFCNEDSNRRTCLRIEEREKERKETAEKLLDEIDYESNGQTKSITDLLRKKYGV